ncbi:MAG: hypothetical protein JJU48_06455 [Methylophaga sp.]|nr:hypothetical protein [Methylophaga sp.]
MRAKNKFLCEHLRALIGAQVTYHKHRCEIIELLDGCELVLQVLDPGSSIQPTQYGEGHRQVPVTYTLQVFDSDGELHADVQAAGLEQLLSEQLPDNR